MFLISRNASSTFLSSGRFHVPWLRWPVWTLCPSVTVPDSGCELSEHRFCRSVVLPMPFGPTTAVRDPRRRSTSGTVSSLVSVPLFEKPTETPRKAYCYVTGA